MNASALPGRQDQRTPRRGSRRGGPAAAPISARRWRIGPCRTAPGCWRTCRFRPSSISIGKNRSAPGGAPASARRRCGVPRPVRACTPARRRRRPDRGPRGWGWRGAGCACRSTSRSSARSARLPHDQPGDVVGPPRAEHLPVPGVVAEEGHLGGADREERRDGELPPRVADGDERHPARREHRGRQRRSSRRTGRVAAPATRPR